MSAEIAVAVVHHHLRGGGVTRVIQHAYRALRREGCRVVILVGESPTDAGEFASDARVVGGLAYDEAEAHDAHDLCSAITGAAKSALGRPPDLYHVHNHSLGKNTALPEALSIMAGLGNRLALQIHDFAEDGRPENYCRLRDRLDIDRFLYPQGDHVHYLLLNGRDHSSLRDAGFDESRVHRLPNAVDLHKGPPDQPDSAPSQRQRLHLYPTRAIRRKNIGEFLLWSAVGEPDDRFALTLAPQNPAERPRYDEWVRFAAEKNLPVRFEAGAAGESSFVQLLASAHSIVTTSIAEGFGLAFLEPFLIGRPLAGRDLPAITSDFLDVGVRLQPLYSKLDTPLAWIGEDRFRRVFTEGIAAAWSRFGRDFPESPIRNAVDSVSSSGSVDFGMLDESMQRDVIEIVRRDKDAASQLAPNRLLPTELSAVHANQRVIAERFSLEGYGARLMDIYRRILDSPIGGASGFPASRVLDQFLSPDRFRLLRS